VKAEKKLQLDTPLNFVLTADIVGGNSGSPIVNRAGELVGLIFDSNLQGLGSSYAYDDRQGRAIAVDARAIIEALRKVYDAPSLVDELTAR
jgi:S1-C subfamily serine protease